MSSPIAVIISDVHYTLKTLELADKAFRQAIDTATELNVPLIDAGDITNDKAVLRAEIVNRLIETMKYAQSKNVKVFLLVGNHSLCNEKGKEHSLNFLSSYATIVDSPTYLLYQDILMIPYQSDFSNMKSISIGLEPNGIPNPIIIMHQGVKGAYMGDYVQDKSSIDPELLKNFTVISGHYHKHQTVGTVTYVGSPYTITYGEANDGPKGFLILNLDGTFTREILNLRKHIIIERNTENLLDPVQDCNEDDLIWLKVKGPKSELQKLNKVTLGNYLFGHSNFKLDLCYEESGITIEPTKTVTNEELFIGLIDGLPEVDEYKQYLKELVNEIIED